MRKILVPMLCLLFLAACGAASTGNTDGAAQPTQPAAEPTTAPEPTAEAEPTAAPTDRPETAAPSPAGGDTSVRPPDDLIQRVQLALAGYLGLAPNAVQLQSANAQDWPDGALGCPAKGVMYPQVVTPGFRLVFSNADQSQIYEVHTGETTSAMIVCENGAPFDLNAVTQQPAAGGSPDPTMPVDDITQHVVDLARAALAQETGAAVADITVVSFEEQIWNDSSLGCPKPDQMYMQVITPGYRIVLETQGRQYEYHTDTSRRVVRC